MLKGILKKSTRPVDSIAGKIVRFCQAVELVLIATKEEYYSCNIAKDVWYSTFDYARFKRRANQSLRFNHEVNVILVASKQEYREWGLTEIIWYTDSDYRRFRLLNVPCCIQLYSFDFLFSKHTGMR